MLRKGFRIQLEPDKYPKHRAIVDKLARRRAWEEITDDGEVLQPEVQAAPQPKQKAEDQILPHQLAALQKLRSKLKQE